MANISRGTIIADKLRLERPLAQGGMGSVWVAQHLQLDTSVAVKFMDPRLASSQTARARFEREARSAAQIKSPHVVHVYDYGIERETPYIVMELLEGQDLGVRLSRGNRLSPVALARILEQSCKALRRAHELGLIHRDLKPANLFLAREDDEEIVKILDFGVAKAQKPETQPMGEVTKSGALIGSPYYMSPEQVRESKHVDHRSDLWSLSIIAYQALTGRLPFQSNELGSVLFAICNAPIPWPSELVPELGPTIDRFFQRALARDPSQRFQSARELYEGFTVLVLGARPSMATLLTRDSSAGWSAPIVVRGPAEPRASFPMPGAPPSPSLGSASTEVEAPELSMSTAPSGASLADVTTLALPDKARSGGMSRGLRRSVLVGLVALGATAAIAVWLAVRMVVHARSSEATPSPTALPPAAAAEPTAPAPAAAAPERASVAAAAGDSAAIELVLEEPEADAGAGADAALALPLRSSRPPSAPAPSEDAPDWFGRHRPSKRERLP